MAATTEGNVKAEIKGNKMLIEIDLTKNIGTTKSGNESVCSRRFVPDGQGDRPATFQIQSWRK